MGRIYIAGPMRGIPEFNFPAFYDAEARFAEAGWEVVNPARKDNESGFDESEKTVEDATANLRDFMSRDLPEVCQCDAIAMLPGWSRSGGAQVELGLARYLGLDVYNTETLSLLTETEEAHEIVYGGRNDSYGHPREDFARAAKILGGILGCEVSAEQIPLVMLGIKMSRHVHKRSRENRVDMIGYTLCDARL